MTTSAAARAITASMGFRARSFAYATATPAVIITTVWHAPTANGSGTKHAHRRTLS